MPSLPIILPKIVDEELKVKVVAEVENLVAGTSKLEDGNIEAQNLTPTPDQNQLEISTNISQDTDISQSSNEKDDESVTYYGGDVTQAIADAYSPALCDMAFISPENIDDSLATTTPDHTSHNGAAQSDLIENGIQKQTSSDLQFNLMRNGVSNHYNGTKIGLGDGLVDIHPTLSFVREAIQQTEQSRTERKQLVGEILKRTRMDVPIANGISPKTSSEPRNVDEN